MGPVEYIKPMGAKKNQGSMWMPYILLRALYARDHNEEMQYMKIDIKNESPEAKIIARALDAWGFKSPTAFVMYAIKEGYKARVAEELRKAGSAPMDRDGIEELQGMDALKFLPVLKDEASFGEER